MDISTLTQNREGQLLKAVYKISSILGISLDYQRTIHQVLKVLHDECQLQRGMLTILDREREILLVDSVHAPEVQNMTDKNRISYQAGEGIVGDVLRQGSSIVITNVGREHRFVDKMALYDYDKPYVCVPLKDANQKVIGALSAQPQNCSDSELTFLTQFLEMTANLIAKNVQLAYRVHEKEEGLVKERDDLRRKVRNNYSFENLVGHTKPMRRIFDQIRLVSRWDSTILIRGESGTGKELVANAIHYNSPRASGPFVKINCAALPDNLLESELFGHEKGAFTGAVKQRKGRFEMADGGTIFLDEIGETSPAFQAKLLRVLQERQFDRVGGTSTISVDVRVIAATNRNLEEEVSKGEFREDIYYRLNVMPIFLPALRDRVEDIPDIAQFMMEKLGKQQQRKLTLTDPALRLMMGYDWPGNVRELENTLERAAVLSENGVIDQDLILFNQIGLTQASPSSPIPAPSATVSPPINSGEMSEREQIVAALEQSGWVKAKAARLLNMTPRQIAYRIQTMNIQIRKL